jgi:hypothetical protein
LLWVLGRKAAFAEQCEGNEVTEGSERKTQLPQNHVKRKHCVCVRSEQSKRRKRA